MLHQHLIKSKKQYWLKKCSVTWCFVVVMFCYSYLWPRHPEYRSTPRFCASSACVHVDELIKWCEDGPSSLTRPRSCLSGATVAVRIIYLFIQLFIFYLSWLACWSYEWHYNLIIILYLPKSNAVLVLDEGNSIPVMQVERQAKL